MVVVFILPCLGSFLGMGGNDFFLRFFSSHISEGKGLRNQGAEKWGLVLCMGARCKVQRGQDAVQPWTQTQKFRGA